MLLRQPHTNIEVTLQQTKVTNACLNASEQMQKSNLKLGAKRGYFEEQKERPFEKSSIDTPCILYTKWKVRSCVRVSLSVSVCACLPVFLVLPDKTQIRLVGRGMGEGRA